MKRLFVVPEARRRGVARQLVAEVLRLAGDEKGYGYDEVLLDTLARMESARAVYRAFGFGEVDAYYGNPLDEVVYLSKRLAGGEEVQC